MYYELPAPIACGMCGALAGLLGGGLNQCTPVWIGATAGGSLGCAISIAICIISRGQPSIPVAQPVETVVHNIFIINDLQSGQAKGIIEKLKKQSSSEVSTTPSKQDA